MAVLYAVMCETAEWGIQAYRYRYWQIIAYMLRVMIIRKLLKQHYGSLVVAVEESWMSIF